MKLSAAGMLALVNSIDEDILNTFDPKLLEEKKKMKKVKFANSELTNLLFGTGSPGFCAACGYFDEYAGCEPDARNYQCAECEENQLFGLEEALMMGMVEAE